MAAFVEQPLGEVHRGDAGFFLEVLQGDDELVARAARRKRDFEAGFSKLGHQVVGVERREFGNAPHAFAAEQPRVNVGAQQHAGIADVRRQAADRLRQILFIEQPVIIAVRSHHRQRQIRQQLRRHADRAGAGAATAVRRRERLVQVHVDYIEAHVAGLDLAENRVQVGAVVIQQPARAVNDLLDIENGALEHAERRRVGQHQSGGMRTDCRLQRGEIDVALPVGRDFLDRIAAHHRGCRVGAVRGIRHQYFGACALAARVVVSADHRYTRKLALRARHRRQAHPGHAGHVLQHFLQLEQAGEESLPGVGGRSGVARQELRQHREMVASARVVFHGARAERVELRIDREVLARQVGVVAHRVELGYLRQQRPRRASLALRDRVELGHGMRRLRRIAAPFA